MKNTLHQDIIKILMYIYHKNFAVLPPNWKHLKTFHDKETEGSDPFRKHKDSFNIYEVTPGIDLKSENIKEKELLLKMMKKKFQKAVLFT